MLFSLDGMRVALARAGMYITLVVPTTKYVSGGYLLGQAASYWPVPLRPLVERGRGLLAARPLHRIVPFRLGEMTVVASRPRRSAGPPKLHEEGPGDHRLLLDPQGPDHRHGRGDIGLLRARDRPVLAVGLGAVAFAIALVLQLWVRRYIAWMYWLAVVMVAIFGTMVADALHIQLGVPYAVSTVGFAVALTAIFIVWYVTERTLSIHHITTLRRELFYWATVCATFALGTAAGDLTAYTLHLGFLASGILFAVVIAVPAIAHRFAHLNAVMAFWFAYIITRPLGASFADWMGVPHASAA